MEPPVSRRTVLQSLTVFAAGAGGCLLGNNDGGANPTTADPTAEPTTTTSPCGPRPEDGDATSAEACAGVTITSVWSSPRTATETQTETRYPGEQGDEVVVRVESDGESQHQLVGCIESSDGVVEVSETVPAEEGTHEFRIGSFDHHGVNNVLVWILGCRETTV